MEHLALSRTYTAGSETFSRLEFRAPTHLEYRQIGAPFDMQRGVVLNDREAIWRWADTLLTAPAVGALAMLDVGDSMALEDHILDFFVEARISRAMSVNLSSGSDGAPPTSTS